MSRAPFLFSRAEAVTPSDTVNFTTTPDAFYIGGAGTVVGISNGSAVTFVGLQAGQYLAGSLSRINATSTTATSIIALYK